jgi:hypothetical protein
MMDAIIDKKRSLLTYHLCDVLFLEHVIKHMLWHDSRIVHNTPINDTIK